jgi:selenoprotein W-related protein
LAAKILTTYKQKLTSLTLIPAGGGCFELSADGQMLYSKLATGSFPDEDDAVKLVGKKLK